MVLFRWLCVLAILSGIIGVLVGGYILKILQIPPGKVLPEMRLIADDYVTRGVSLGINASAISTAQLLSTDPRAAALSSLSFAYGCLCTDWLMGVYLVHLWLC